MGEQQVKEVPITAEHAIYIASALGIKGPNFFSCDPNQFSDGSNIMSIAYEPAVGGGHAYVAWEDGSGDSWIPAACTTYVHLDFARWWGGSNESGTRMSTVVV